VLWRFVSLISSSKQTTLVLAPFYFRAYYPSYRNLHWESNPGKFFGVLVFVSVISSTKNNFDLSAILLSCLVSELQETPSPAIELRHVSGVLTPYFLFLVSRNKHAKFGANRYI
jgi:hypothetical protein